MSFHLEVFYIESIPIGITLVEGILLVHIGDGQVYQGYISSVWLTSYHIQFLRSSTGPCLLIKMSLLLRLYNCWPWQQTYLCTVYFVMLCGHVSWCGKTYPRDRFRNNWQQTYLCTVYFVMLCGHVSWCGKTCPRDRFSNNWQQTYLCSLNLLCRSRVSV
jgi:hypothetical protein